MEFHRRDLGLLVSLDVLLSERSVTVAAKRLGVSQPAMSAQLAKLRQLFGDDLLIGNAHGMALTPRAEEIHGPLGEAIEDLRALVALSVPFDPAADSRVFRIAASDLVLGILLPRLLPVLSDRAPRVRIEGVPLAIDRLASSMEKGEIDFAVTNAENAPQSFPARLLSNEEFCIIWRKDHPELSAPPTLDQFCRIPQVFALVEGAGERDAVDDHLATMGRGRVLGIRVPNFLLVAPLVRATDMIAVVPRRLAETETEGLNVADTPFPLPSSQVYLSWHRRLHQDSACRWFRQLVAETITSDPARN
ncbi:LysR family transcriptional regulator [Paracoccus sp. MBLB3053]|uniref:LysR family transcriptional regulator n=1 Tax=Paracoccus aurantius TaxID=3073814 RepID=A0ABU2HYY0_9RHOB|nr:LysR family transcriptional regulator [Paracoccus sp. MBLB3053]MDS9469489.1 LysR family transcriptional regulator [Paracoccus sp. MBLB3053]